MSQKIKFVVVTTSSRRDINGNCYHIAAVTNTETGARVHFHTGGASNAGYLIKDMFNLKHGETLDIERDLGIRDFNTAKKYVKLCEHEEDEIRKALKGGE